MNKQMRDVAAYYSAQERPDTDPIAELTFNSFSSVHRSPRWFSDTRRAGLHKLSRSGGDWPQSISLSRGQHANYLEAQLRPEEWTAQSKNNAASSWNRLPGGFRPGDQGTCHLFRIHPAGRSDP